MGQWLLGSGLVVQFLVRIVVVLTRSASRVYTRGQRSGVVSDAWCLFLAQAGIGLNGRRPALHRPVDTPTYLLLTSSP